MNKDIIIIIAVGIIFVTLWPIVVLKYRKSIKVKKYEVEFTGNRIEEDVLRLSPRVNKLNINIQIDKSDVDIDSIVCDMSVNLEQLLNGTYKVPEHLAKRIKKDVVKEESILFSKVNFEEFSDPLI